MPWTRVTICSCIDREPSGCPQHLDVCHYVVVRSDIPHGAQVAQAVHAAGESTRERVLPGTIAVALHARDEAHLRELHEKLVVANIPHHVVEECDGQWMAIGIEPTTNRAAIRKVTSALPLVR